MISERTRAALAELKSYHATMLVTRAEEWCVEAESAEEARQLLAAGGGHRSHLGDRLHMRWSASRTEAARRWAAVAGWLKPSANARRVQTTESQREYPVPTGNQIRMY